MKVSQSALIFTIASCTTVVQGHTFRKNVDASKFDKRALMQNAKRVGRKLEQGGQDGQGEDAQENGEFELNGLESVIFKSCQTITVESDAQTDAAAQMVASGVARGVQSFVEFDVCESEKCFTGEEGARTPFLVPLEDYIMGLSGFLPTKQQEYCQGCINNNDYCQIAYYPNSNVEMPSQYWYDYKAQAQQNGNYNGGGNRRLQESGVYYEAIECNVCRSFNCMYTSNEEYNYRQEWTQENSLAWIQNMATCYRNENYPVMLGDNTQASFAFVCNADGTGVEIGTFLDEDCTIYDSKIHFGNVMSQSDYYFYTQSKSNIEYIFENSFSCYDPEVTYVNPNQYANLATQNQNEAVNEGEEAPQAGEWCWNIFNGNVEPVNMNECNDTTIDDWADVDAAVYASAQALAAGDWENYTESYVLQQDDLQDMSAACSYLMAHNFTGTSVYDKKGSGSMYSFSDGSSTVTEESAAAGDAAVATNATQTDANWWNNFWGNGNSAGKNATVYDSESSTEAASTANNNWKQTLSQMSAEGKKNAAKVAKSGRKLGTTGIVFIVLACVAAGFGVASMIYSKKKNSSSSSSSVSSKEEPMLGKEEENTGVIA